MLFLNVMTPMSEIHRVLDEGHESSLRVGDLLEMLNEPVDPSPSRRSGRASRGCVPGEPGISSANLIVEYLTPQGKRLQALDDLSLTIHTAKPSASPAFRLRQIDPVARS